MKLGFIFFLFGVVILNSPFAFSTGTDQLLLKQKTGKTSSKDGLQSGRYQVKTEGPARVEDPELVNDVPMPESLKKKVTQKPKKSPASSAPPVVVSVPKKEEPAKATEEKAVETKEDPSFSDQMKGLLDGDRSEIESYKEQVHPDDIRLNRIEIDILPGLMYNASRASMSYRSYQQFSPTLGFGAELWLTPMIGVKGKVINTMGSDVSSNGSLVNRVPSKNEWTELSVDFRKFFGLSRKSNSLTFGLHYGDYQFLVPSDEATRIRTRSAGLGAHLVGRFPTAPSYTWVFGGMIQPRISHKEVSTGLNLQSGTGQESSKMGILIGGEFKMSRQHQIIWELSTQFERNQFSGTSNITDSETGVTAQNVSVTNSWTFFTLGYRWGR